MRKLGTLVGLVVIVTACGGGEKRADTSAAAAPPAAGATSAAPGAGAAAGTAMPATGATHEVKMVMDAQGQYKFDPANITVKRGDAIKFTTVSGQPHNVSFWPDSIPAGAATQLGANMSNTTAPLVGPLLNNPGESYTISFAGVPAGVYKMYCTPHLALGMKGAVTVQ